MSEYVAMTLSIPIYLGVVVSSLIIGGLVVGVSFSSSLYPKATEVLETANLKIKNAPPESVIFFSQAAVEGAKAVKTAAEAFKMLIKGDSEGGSSEGGGSVLPNITGVPGAIAGVPDVPGAIAGVPGAIASVPDNRDSISSTASTIDNNTQDTAKNLANLNSLAQNQIPHTGGKKTKSKRPKSTKSNNPRKPRTKRMMKKVGDQLYMKFSL